MKRIKIGKQSLDMKGIKIGKQSLDMKGIRNTNKRNVVFGREGRTR